MKKLIASMLVVASIFTQTAFAMDMPSKVTGYIGGYNDGTVRPEANIIRAEMAQIVTNIMHFTNGSTKFNDVNDTEWYYSAVSAVSQHNLFTVGTYPQLINTPSADYPMTTLVNGIYDSLNMNSAAQGPEPLRENSFINSAGPEKAKLQKLMSWGFMQRYTDESLDTSYSEASMPFELAAEDVNKMLTLIYPNGISIDKLGDPGFGTDAASVYGVSWEVTTKFRPNENMTREEMALVLYRMTDKQTVATANYSDISKLSVESKNAISSLASKGVITGYPDGTFKPMASITRAEAIVMINRFFGDAVVDSNSTFNPTDLKGHWAEAQIRKILKNTEVRDTSKDIDWSQVTGW